MTKSVCSSLQLAPNGLSLSVPNAVMLVNRWCWKVNILAMAKANSLGQIFCDFHTCQRLFYCLIIDFYCCPPLDSRESEHSSGGRGCFVSSWGVVIRSLPCVSMRYIFFFNCSVLQQMVYNPAYGRHWTSGPMRVVDKGGPRNLDPSFFPYKNLAFSFTRT